jgi:autotransporter translocation and assembly factor TamB
MEKTALDVRLRESRDIWVDNNLARIRLRTELNMIGTAVHPNVAGRVAVEEGYVWYLDRKFRITQFTADFSDPNRMNPIVDLRAETKLRSYQTQTGKPYDITLLVTGPVDQARVELTSVPPLDRPDILALLTLGRTREEISDRELEGRKPGATSIALERAQDLSSRKIAGYTERKLGGFLGLEEITIEGNLFRFDRSWGPRLVASRKLSGRLDLTYSTTVGHMNDQSIRLDYRLWRQLSLEGHTDQRGRSGIDLKYKLRYK